MIGVLFFAAAVVGFLFVVARPQWTAPYLALLLYSRLSDSIRAEYGLPSLFMFILPALFALALWRWLKTGERLGAGTAPAVWWMTAYGLVGISSVLYARDPSLTIDSMLNYADGFLVVVVMAMTLRTRDDVRRIAWAVLIAGFALSAVAVFQQTTGQFGDTFAGFARVELRNIHDDAAGYRSEGPVSANYFAMILVAVVPIAVDRLLHARPAPQRVFAGVTALLCVAAIYYTSSRGGLVALAVTSIPMLSWVSRKTLIRGAAILALPLAIATVQMTSTDYGQRILALTQVFGASSSNAPQDGALRGRLSEVTSAAMMFADHPLLGVGVGNYENHYHRYAQQVALDGRREERQAHSLYLEIAAESGLLGIVVFGALILYAALGPLRARNALRDEGDEETAQIMAALGVAFFGYLVGSLFLHLSYPRYFWLMVGIALGARQWVSVSWPARPSHAREGAPSEIGMQGATS